MAGQTTNRVHPLIERTAAYAWRILIIAAAFAGVMWLLDKLWVVVLPLIIAAFLTRVLMAPNQWLRRHGWRPMLAAATVLLSFLVCLIGLIGAVGYSVSQQAQQVGPALTNAVDDIEDWVVNDAPVDVSRADVQDARNDARKSIERWARSSGGTLVSGAVVFFEVLIGIFLGLIITFFTLKDGDRFAKWLLSFIPTQRQRHVSQLSAKAWSTLGGYLRGAAMLGFIEGLVVAIAVTLVGAKLAAAVAVITFLMAFIPFAGGIIAGAVAVLVTFSTAGLGGALIVLAVAILVQQTDSHLLAPVVYGKELDLHPVVVLLTITAGGTLFGIVGAFLAVPITAVVVNVIAEHRRIQNDRAMIPVDAMALQPD